jgi:hypothetical protein
VVRPSPDISPMPYFHQYSNRLNPSGSCQNTCVAIVLKYYGADDITPDKISAKWGTYVAQTTGGLESVFNVMVNEDTPSLIPLIDGDVEEVELELGRDEWQVVEIPLALFYRLDGPIESICLFGNLRGTFYLDDVRLVAARIDGATAVREEGGPDVFALAQNYPNPFNSGTVIGFDLTQQGEVKLEIFNLLGQSVAVLAEGTRLAGRYAVHWDGLHQ